MYNTQMTEIAPQRPSKYVSLTPGERLAFRESVNPHAQNAREARQILREFEQLDQSYQEMRDLYRHSSGPYRDILTSSIEEIKSEQERLGGNIMRNQVRERYRIEVNEIKREVNRLNAIEAIRKREVHPLAASLRNQPQLPLISGSERREPHSPPLLHHGLGILPTHRRVDIPGDIQLSISREVVNQGSNVLVNKDIMLNVANLLPDNCRDRSLYHRPSPFRESDRIGKAIVEVTKLILAFDRGEVIMPHPEEYALPNAEQDKHIEAVVRIILLHELHEELKDPYKDENQYRRAIQNNISRSINTLAERIGSDGYTRVASAIESLSDVEVALLRSRFSIETDVKLGFPRSDLAHEKRFAEMLSWSVYAHRRNIDVQAEAVDLILGKLTERVEVSDIDVNAIFASVEALEYGENLISQIFDVANDESIALLLEALRESGSFKPLVSK